MGEEVAADTINGPETVIYRSRREQTVTALSGIVFAVLGLAGLSAATSPVFPSIMLAFGLLWFARCLWGFRVLLTPSTLIVRPLGPTTRFALKDLRVVDTAAANPIIGKRRRALRVMSLDGTVRVFPEINADAKAVDHELDRAVQQIQAALS